MKQARRLVHYREYKHVFETQQSYLFSSKFQIVQFVNYFACNRGEGSVPVLDRVEITPIESRKITKSRPDICSIAEKARETA